MGKYLQAISARFNQFPLTQRLSIVVSGLLVVAIFLTIGNSRSGEIKKIYAQNVVTPTLYCLGNCPSATPTAAQGGTVTPIPSGVPIASIPPPTGVCSPTPQNGQAFYIAPNGTDANPGTSDAPWGTFAFAIAKLQPGSTLILKDGTYDKSNSGNLNFENINGTTSQPITIKAENERKAWIKDDGSWAGISVVNSSFLVFEGLRVSSADNSSFRNGGEPVSVNKSNNLTFRRMLLHEPNRFCNCHVLDVGESEKVLVEESEFYNFHRHALVFGASAEGGNTNNSVSRRNYCNSRLTPGVEGGNADDNARGDACVAIYPGNDNIIENTISENNDHLIELNGSGRNTNNKVLGGISFKDWNVVRPNSRGYDLDSMVRDSVISNFVALDAETAIKVEGEVNYRWDNITLLNSAGSAFLSQNPDAGDYAVSPSFFMSNALIANNKDTGIIVIGTPDFQVDYVNAYNNGVDFTPAGNARFTNIKTLDPQLGTCKVWIPDSSPMKRAGKNGADIGANILYRYENGQLTNQPLWTADGSIPHGAVIEGINDVPGQSLYDLQNRLNINKNGCNFPSGYVPGNPGDNGSQCPGSGTPAVSPAPTSSPSNSPSDTGSPQGLLQQLLDLIQKFLQFIQTLFVRGS